MLSTTGVGAGSGAGAAAFISALFGPTPTHPIFGTEAALLESGCEVIVSGGGGGGPVVEAPAAAIISFDVVPIVVAPTLLLQGVSVVEPIASSPPGSEPLTWNEITSTWNAETNSWNDI